MLSNEYIKYGLPPLIKPESIPNYIDFLSEKAEFQNEEKSEQSDDSKSNETCSSAPTEEMKHTELFTDNNKPSQIETVLIPNKLDEKFILDPLSVIIKLAILSKKPKGSKICIYNNVMYIQEPGLFQPFIRYFFKNNKDDLHYLYNPIELACSHYLKKTPKIRKLFVYAKEGLEYLMEHYKHSKVIIHTIIMYYNIISNYLSNSFNKDLFIKDSVSTLYDSEVLELLNSKWNQNKIKVVLDIIDFIDKETDRDKTFEKQTNIKCLDEFMINIDAENQKIISQYFKNKTDETKY